MHVLVILTASAHTWRELRFVSASERPDRLFVVALLDLEFERMILTALNPGGSKPWKVFCTKGDE